MEKTTLKSFYLKKLKLLIMPIAFIPLLLGTSKSFSQVTLYSFSQSMGTYTEITGGTAVLTCDNCGTTYDTNSYVITLPAPLSLNGVSTTSVVMRVDGSLVIGSTSTSSSVSPISASTTAPAVIAALGMDLRNSTVAGAVYELRWEEIGDTYVFQWKDAARWAQNTTERLNFQIRINKTTGTVNIVYGNMTGVGTSTTYQPQVGLRGATSSDYNARRLTTTVPDDTPSWDNTDVAFSNSNTVRFTTSAPAATPASGLTFTYSPPPACTGTPEGGIITGDLQRFICNGAAPGAITVTGASSLASSGISYQWEESIDAGTSWANATGGTGATTAAYTPPNYAGAAIQYRLKVTCANGGGFDNSDVLMVNTLGVPATQATALITTNVGSTAFTVTWTNGDGARRHVLFSTSPIVDPVNGTGIAAYTADDEWANAGQQIVYDGTGSSVTVTGLTCNTTYYVKVYEYSRCGSGPYDVYFNTTTGTNAITVTGPLTAGTLPVTNDFTDFTGTNLGAVAPGWYESAIDTEDGAEPVSVNPVGITSVWTGTTNLGVRTAKINLFTDNRNAWIISPKIVLTSNSRFKFKAAISDFANGLPHDEGMQGTDDKVKVMVTTDCGATWTTLYTFEAANTVSLTNVLTDYTLSLNAFTGQTIQLAFQGTDGPADNSPDYDFHITNLLVEELPSCDVPVVAAPDAVTKNSVSISWTAPTVGVPTGYEYAVITTDTAPASGTETTETSIDVTGLLPSTTYYVFVRTECTDVFSDWSLAQTFTTLCDYPDLLTTTGDSVCGQGEATLTATVGTGGMVNWYAEAEGGAPLATGLSFTTELLTETTDFYASSGIPVASTDVTVGAGGTTSSSGGNSPYYHGWGGVKTQYIVRASELQTSGLVAGPINSVAFTITSLGTATFNNFAVSVGTTTQDVATTTHVAGLTQVYTNAAQPLTAGVNNYTFTTPFVWDGTSNIVIQVCYSNVNTGGSSSTVQYDTASYVGTTYTYADSQSAADICSATTGSVNGSGGTLAVAGRAKMIINGTAICSSPRVAVTATVTDAPDITVTAVEAICDGESTDLNVTSANAGYTYMWMPGSLAGAMQTVTPTETTTYTVTATDAITGCVEVGQITITVNPLPVIEEDLTDVEICEGGVGELTLGVNTDVTVLSGIGESTSVAQTFATTLGPNPLQNYYGGNKQQWIYTAAELTAMGFVAGSEITAIALDLETANNAVVLNGLEIRMKNASETSFATTTSWISGMTIVKPEANYNPVVGLNTFTLTTPFAWDGTSSLAIQMRYSNDNIPTEGTNAAMFSSTAFVSTIFYRADSMTAAEIGDYTGTATATYSQRNDVTFTFVNNITIEWMPLTNLYTDAAATVPYTGGHAATVYTKPSAAISYSAIATTEEGCSVTSSMADITINIIAAPTATATQSFCSAATVANLTATGDMIKWYYEATGGTALTGTTMLLDGTVYYASQTVDGCESMARVAVTAEVNVTAAPVIDEEVQLICNAGTVADLMATGTDIQWYTTATGGVALTPDTALEGDISIYYASQTVDGCESSMRAAVAVFVNVVEAPVADAEQSFCNEGTVANLMPNGVGITWYADETTTTPLTAETVLVTGTTYYASQTMEGCESLVRTAVMATINVTAAPTANAEQSFCAGGFVEELIAEGNDIMWYAAETGGEPLANGDVLVDGTTYYASQMVDGCESTTRTAVMVIINVTPAPEGDAMQTVEVNAAADATIEDLVVTGVEGGVIVWYASEEDAMNNTSPIAAGTQLESETTYYAVQFVGDCASEPFAVTVTVALDIRDFASAEFKYYPNPVKDVLTISYSSNITSVTVYNMLGQPVISQNVNALEGSVNMAGLADGTYIVNVTAGSASKTIRVIKKQ